MKSIAVITARGGSKRIPRKNIKEFCGKPIIAYSIEAALKSGVFDTVMVSTDDEEIAEISRKYGAEVPFLRSEATSNDYAATADVLLEVIEEYKKRGEEFEILSCIYPTAPFITPERLKEADKAFRDGDADNLIPVVDFSYPPQRAMHVVDGYLEAVYPQYLNSRSQDLEKHYHDAGQFYFTRVERFEVNKHLMKGKIMPFLLSELEVQDIDNETDWELAELKYKLLTDMKKQKRL